MGFQGLKCRYEKLSFPEEKAKTARPRRRWVRKVNGGLKGLRLSSSRKLTLKVFSVIVSPSRIARIYADIVNRMKKMDGVCPTIIFSTQWGLPVLSHPSVKCRKSVINLDRNFTCFH